MNHFNYKLKYDIKIICNLAKKQALLAFIVLLFFEISILYGNDTKQKTLSLQQISLSLNSLANSIANINRDIIKPIKVKFDGYNFDEWYEKCIAKPYYKIQKKPQSRQYVAISELNRAIKEFVKVNTNILTTSNSWIKNAPISTDQFFTIEGPLVPIQPFVQKLIVKPGTKIAFHGDFHGDKLSMGKYIKALQMLGYMNGFTIKDPSKFYLVFLGDYVDRGIYGAEVLYTLMHLKIANPNNVIILRGNHEAFTQNKTDGFLNEMTTKYSLQEWHNIVRIYDLLPTALYLGSGTNIKNYLLCVHGGLEPRFDSKNLLTSNKPLAYDWLKFSPENKFPKDYDIGFMWNDFNVNPKEPNYLSDRGEGLYKFGKAYTEKFLHDNSNSGASYFLKGVFRAHQHGDRNMINSIFQGNGVSKLWLDRSVASKKLWDNIVAAFLVAPDTPYGRDYNYDYDAFAILTTAEQFKHWNLEIYNNEDVFAKDLKIINKSQKSQKTKEKLLEEAKILLEMSNLLKKQIELYSSMKEKLEEKLAGTLSKADRQKYTILLQETIEKTNDLHNEAQLLLAKVDAKINAAKNLSN